MTKALPSMTRLSRVRERLIPLVLSKGHLLWGRKIDSLSRCDHSDSAAETTRNNSCCGLLLTLRIRIYCSQWLRMLSAQQCADLIDHRLVNDIH